MASIFVTFRYLTGLKRQIFSGATLSGSWNGQGNSSETWSSIPMTPILAEDGCPCFTATVALDDSNLGKVFQWGVAVDGPQGQGVWGIPTELNDMNSTARYRSFTLSRDASATNQDFYLTYIRRLGARKVFKAGSTVPDLRFAVWAPNARKIDVVFGLTKNGYIADDGTGIDPSRPAISLTKDADNIWLSPVIAGFDALDGGPYMYRITNAQGQVVYRTDLFSRNQIGRGSTDPQGAHYTGDPSTLDGTKSCSLIRGLGTVAQDVSNPDGARIPEAQFWANEFTPGSPLPANLADLIIYELHVNALAAGQSGPGTLEDAIDLLPYLSDLGVNAVELLPMCEFSGGFGWGYGDSHYFTIESAAGRRDQYKHFVRECHRRGIAVIQDVCYNHYDANAARDEWQYDSTAPDQNIYYWYEGLPSQYSFPEGGYVDNGSTGYAPRYWEETVRHLFVSSAAALVEEFHIDGIRVDLTQAIHRDNVLHANGNSLGNVNLFGQKMLREWSRTLRLIKPGVMLIAEDHTGWPAVVQPPDAGGLGFDATWYAEFYHQLVGDSDGAGGKARLIKTAGLGGDGPLDIEQFAGALYSTQSGKVVYHESHDEAGNDQGTQRTIVCAVNNAPLFGTTRDYAEARCRVAYALSLFSAATPMFFMGEEIGAQQPYRYNDFMTHRETLVADRQGDGAHLFTFYADINRFSRAHPATRSSNIDIIHAIGANRLIAFTRSSGADQLLIIASLRDEPFLDGYVLQTDPSRLPDGLWREVFNSDSTVYGGQGTGNFGASIPASGGRFQANVPANGVLVFQKT